MNVQELIDILSNFDPTAEVRFTDTYAQREGWEDNNEVITCSIDAVRPDVTGSIVILEEFL